MYSTILATACFPIASFAVDHEFSSAFTVSAPAHRVTDTRTAANCTSSQRRDHDDAGDEKSDCSVDTCDEKKIHHTSLYSTPAALRRKEVCCEESRSLDACSSAPGPLDGLCTLGVDPSYNRFRHIQRVGAGCAVERYDCGCCGFLIVQRSKCVRLPVREKEVFLKRRILACHKLSVGRGG